MDLHPDPNERFWFVIDVAIGREHGRPLAGPAPADVFPQPPPDLILASLRQALDWFVANDATGVGAVFGACRAWAWAHDGRWRSKAESAEWARDANDRSGPGREGHAPPRRLAGTRPSANPRWRPWSTAPVPLWATEDARRGPGRTSSFVPARGSFGSRLEPGR